MKKAKILLSAMGLLSIIGGALAFKAQSKFNGSWFCTTTYNGNCLGAYTTVGAGLVTSYCTKIEDEPCTTTTKVRFQL